VTVIVSFTRRIGRHHDAEVLQRALGQRFVVENRPGAGGKKGISYAAKASPDGAVELTIGYWDRSCIHR
jgi:tripartite-type tricarboxylate transporter receptor subunit TctC